MCGIAGVIAFAERYRTSRQVLASMSRAIAHRGPDGEGIYADDGSAGQRPQAAMAFRRLAILDTDPRAMQPMHLRDDAGQVRLSIVFNGEIYNFRELRRELEAVRPDYAWRTSGDAEVLLLAYDTWRGECLAKLNGMFAFAAWDSASGELFLARDRMGQKPLYVAISHEGGGVSAVAFASELPALRPLDWIDWSTDRAALADYLALGYADEGRSIYAGVRQILPGQAMTVGRGAAMAASYWAVSGERVDGAGAAGQTRERVARAVGRQLVSDVPLGCFLSGGIDSSIIAACMRAAVPRDQEVLTFSIGFEDPRYDERAFAREVAAHLGTRHHEFVVRPDAAADLAALATAFGEPLADSSALPTHYLSRETRGLVKVALSGDGGDELFGGYDRYRAMRLERFVRATPSPARNAARLAGKWIGGGHPKSRAARLGRLLETLHLPPAQRYAGYLWLFSPALAGELTGDEKAARDVESRLVHQIEGLLAAMDAPNAARTWDIGHYLPGDLLTKVDRASMRHALEVRSPFMDHDLVSFAVGLTGEQLLRGGPKRLLREAFAADLPASVFSRRKMGFAVPIGDWLRSSLRPMLHDLLFAKDAFAGAHFQAATIRRMIEDHDAGRRDHSQRLYALLMLELWRKSR